MLSDLWNSEVTWITGLLGLVVIVVLGVMAFGLVAIADDMSRVAAAKVRAWWAAQQVGLLPSATPLAIAVIVSTALVLSVWIVMYLSPYAICVRLMGIEESSSDAAAVCAHHLSRQ